MATARREKDALSQQLAMSEAEKESIARSRFFSGLWELLGGHACVIIGQKSRGFKIAPARRTDQSLDFCNPKSTGKQKDNPLVYINKHSQTPTSQEQHSGRRYNH